MASVHLLTYSQMAYSEDIKSGLRAQGYDPLESHTGISKAISRYGSKVKNEIKELLKEMMNKDVRFSITTDEFTAKNHKRYADFFVHIPGLKPKSIGMERIHGSLDAEAAGEMCKNKLSQFGVSLDRHICGGTTDGASVMVKMGESLPIVHQICLTHGIHLAVVDVIYKVV